MKKKTNKQTQTRSILYPWCR